MIRIPIHRTPTHPGEMLLEEFLKPMNLTQQALAEAIHLSNQQVGDIVDGCQEVTPSTALRLSKYFGTTADFWMTLQMRWDIYHAQKSESKTLASIQPRQFA